MPSSKIDTDKIDECTLALMTLTFHAGAADETRAWKGHDWDVLGRLHSKGYIYDPVGKTKSIVLTKKGVKQARQLFKRLFECDSA